MATSKNAAGDEDAEEMDEASGLPISTLEFHQK
jgi:hypothetical protein